MPLLYLIVGARPNFMKIAPIVRALSAQPSLRYLLVHTGQHYDHDMNDVFFNELGIPKPDVSMGAGGGSHAYQTAKIMTAFEDLCQERRPDAVLVVGDVNSTMACAIVAKKLSIPVGHVEAGLRSGDMHMPEEINRVVTDSISDWFFVTEPSGMENLRREGKQAHTIHFVGHVMVDNLLYQVEKLRHSNAEALATTPLKARLVASGRYGVVTLHRPSNVDDEETLSRLCSVLSDIGRELPLVFPVHPRTRESIERFGIAVGPNVTLIGPQGYMAFLNLWMDATAVITDSGGLQEETTALGVPCITLRDNTERPVTVEEGTNQLVGTDPDRIIAAVREVLMGNGKKGRQPAFWDGQASARIIDVLTKELA